MRTAASIATLVALTATAQSPVVKSEFIYDTAPFPSAHASTIVETRSGLVAAWFGGTAERNPDVGIWVSRHTPSTDSARSGQPPSAGSGQGVWSAPVEVANGVQADGTRLPTWNPVLFQPTGGPLVLFYKVGPSPRDWWGMVRTSADDGRTWSAAGRLPDGILGPIRAKPVELPDGTMLAGSSTEHDGWVVHMERFKPRGAKWTMDALVDRTSWERSKPLNDAKEFGAIQPTILMHSPTRIQVLCRSRQLVVTESWSEDGGKTWSPMKATELPNPSAGIDAVKLPDGRFLLIYNPVAKGRDRLDIAISPDGRTWKRAVELENSPGEYSYPAIIGSRDGMIHATYTWKRQRIRHAVLDGRKLQPSS